MKPMQRCQKVPFTLAAGLKNKVNPNRVEFSDFKALIWIVHPFKTMASIKSQPLSC